MSTPIEPATLAWLPIVNSLAPAFFGFVGVLAGGYLSHSQMVTQHASDAESEKRIRVRERLEELYVVCHLEAKKVRATHNMLRWLMKGEMTEDIAAEEIGKLFNDMESQRKEMIAEIYFPEGRKQLRKVGEMYKKLASIYEDFNLQFKIDGMPSHSHATQLDEALKEFEQCYHDYLLALAKHVRKSY